MKTEKKNMFQVEIILYSIENHLHVFHFNKLFQKCYPASLFFNLHHQTIMGMHASLILRSLHHTNYFSVSFSLGSKHSNLHFNLIQFLCFTTQGMPFVLESACSLGTRNHLISG